MKVGSLFSGIGGLDLGLERAGMEIVWQAENDPYCCRVLEKHWPDIPNLGDVATIDWSEVEHVDLICGGFPCQPVSVAGQQRGTDDERWLWPEFAHAIRHLRPRYVLVENVPGLLVRGMGDVLGELAGLGYDAEWASVPAAAVGAPHLRYRIFIVAHADKRAIASERGERAFASSQGVGRRDNGGRSASDVERQVSVRGTGEDSVLADTDSTRPQGGGIFATTPDRGDWWAVEPDMGRVVTRISTELDGGLDAHSECITQARSAGLPQTRCMQFLREYLTSPAASSEPPRCGICGHPLSTMPCSGTCTPWRLECGSEKTENVRCMREGVLGLLARSGEDMRPFLSGGTWTTKCTQAMGSRTDRLRALGNAVVPQVAEWVGRQILEADR